ncbi:MAG TPA: hypothetical protein DCZ40_08985 [Lachnospiraceae bacterium]|nr:hypothetical protein [Lachnospiraceae bacterium]
MVRMKHFKKGMAVTLALSMVLGTSGVPASAAQKGAAAKVQGVSIQKPDTATLVLKKNAKFQLKTKVTVKGKISKKVTYKSSNSKVVTVNKKGKLTAKKKGTAKITVASQANRSKKAVLTVKVGTPVKAVKLNAAKLSGEVGKSGNLKAAVSPKNATVAKVAFTSSNAKVAEVSSKGEVSFLKKGTANITAKAQDGSGKKAVCKVTVTEPKAPAESASPVEPTETPGSIDYSQYNLKWQDEFDGDSLNRDDWNVELHEPGWVNAELQEYVDSNENIYLKDGKLEIKPIQTKNADGTYSYTSGRITTQNKHDYTYGLFEARVKVPTGKGYLPAFWMMPTDENIYGQWPRCGEIDIMEVMGDDTKKAHNTIHYGNPHSQNQGTYTLEEGSFAEEYHTFAVEWLPGELIWYIDGKETFRTNDWHSTTEGQGTVTYPAPFDQPFHIILNLAVGGSWVGYPDDATFESQNYSVDYVKVWQKDSYDDSDVKKPVKDVVLRDPDANGNYVVNGDFAVAEDLTDEENWQFLTQSEGEATAEIKEKAININTTKEGTVDYSIQLVQPNLPMQKGATYKVSYDAYADEARKMMSKVSAPDNGWAVYGGGETIDLTTEKQTYTYEFRMTSDDDANGRLEFNMGAYGSTAGIHISNVKVEKTAYEPIVEGDNKTILADGNFVYNGGFQEGEKHLGFWDITKNDGAEVSVTNKSASDRRLEVVAPAGTSKDSPVVISQKKLALTDGNYAVSFDIEAESGKTVNVSVAGVEKSVELSGGKQAYSDKITLKDAKTTDIVFTFTAPGTYYLDNVRIVEDTLIKNGSFNAGFAGFEPYADGSASATWVVDSLTEDNAADYTINDTGDADWKIQLKQNNVELEKGQWYRFTLQAKSSMDRKFMYAIQRDGSKHNDDWTPYIQKTADLTGEWQTFTEEFQMTEDTDLESVLSISMGAVGGVQIKDQHRICIDNINLEKIDAPATTPEPDVPTSTPEPDVPTSTPEPGVPENPAGENLLKNGDFSSGKDSWIEAVTAPGAASISYEDKKAIFDITDVGTEEWNVQFKQEGITLEKGSTYTVKFKATSTADRTIKLAMMSTDDKYTWYGGEDIALEAGKEKEVTVTFTMDKDTDTSAALFLSMGLIEGKDTPASKITLSDVSLVKAQ